MKQFLTVVAVGVIGAFVLIACGGDKKPAETGGMENTEGAATTTTETTTTTTATEATSAAPAST
jgi:hypothetical protein